MMYKHTLILLDEAGYEIMRWSRRYTAKRVSIGDMLVHCNIDSLHFDNCQSMRVEVKEVEDAEEVYDE